MSVRRFPLFILLGLVIAPAPALAQPAKAAPTLAVRVRSIDTLIGDAKYLATLAGAEEQAKQFDGLIKSRVGAKGLEGIDPKRPLGLYASLGANGFVDSTIVVMVPIVDSASFLDLLERLNLKAEKGKDGVYTVRPKGSPVEVYFRFANQYAYATVLNPAAIAKNRLTDPATLLAAKDAGAVSVSVRVDQIPDEIKQLALGQIELRAADAQEQKRPGETELEHKARVVVIKDAVQQLTTLIKEGQLLAVKLDLDRKNHEITAEATLTGKSGSKLSTSIAEYGQIKSLFAGALGTDSAMNGFVHAIVSANLKKALDSLLDEMSQSALDQEKDAAKRAMAEKMVKAVMPSLKSGDLDAGFTLRGPGKDGHYGLVLGVKLKDGLEIEKTARDLLAQAPEGDRKKIQLDVESAGAVKIHRIDIGKELDKTSQAIFGEHPLYVAFRSDAVFLARGEDALAALKEAVNAKPQAGPQLQLGIALKRFAPLMAQRNKDAVKHAEESFSKGSGDDQQRLMLEGGKELRLRFILKTAVVKFLALVEKDNAAPGQ